MWPWTCERKWPICPHVWLFSQVITQSLKKRLFSNQYYEATVADWHRGQLEFTNQPVSCLHLDTPVQCIYVVRFQIQLVLMSILSCSECVFIYYFIFCSLLSHDLILNLTQDGIKTTFTAFNQRLKVTINDNWSFMSGWLMCAVVECFWNSWVGVGLGTRDSHNIGDWSCRPPKREAGGRLGWLERDWEGL